MNDNKNEIENTEAEEYIELVIVRNNSGNNNGSYYKLKNPKQVTKLMKSTDATLTFPPYKIGDTLLIDHIDFPDENTKDEYYDKLIINKDFLGTITTIKRNDSIEFEIHHEYYMNVSINKDDNLIEFGVDNYILTALLFSFIIPVIIFSKKFLKKK